MIFKFNNILIIATLFITSLLTMELYSVEAASNLRGGRDDINPNREQRTLTDCEDIGDTASTNITATTTVNNTSADEEQNITTWPQLCGLKGEEAKAILKSTYGDEYEIKIIYENSPSTREYEFKRIKIAIDEQSQIVKQIPHIG